MRWDKGWDETEYVIRKGIGGELQDRCRTVSGMRYERTWGGGEAGFKDHAGGMWGFGVPALERLEAPLVGGWGWSCAQSAEAPSGQQGTL